MRLRNWIVNSLLALIAAAPLARAADANSTVPTVVVRIKSIDGLMADARYLAGLAGQQEQATQLEKTLPAFLGPKGLAGTGIDTAKPWGMYGILKTELPKSPVVVLIPVADENAFVEALNTFAGYAPGGNVTIKKGNDGVYTVNSPAAPVEAYFTIADGYAYITALQKDSIAKENRLPAAKLFPSDDKTILGITARLDTIDAQFKQIALGQFENQIAAAKEKKAPNETPAQAKLKNDLVDYAAGQVRSLLTDAKALELQIVLDRKTDDASAQLTLSAKPDSPLATEIAAVGNRDSRFGPLSGTAGQAAFNIAIPKVLRPAVVAAFDEGFKDAQDRQKDVIKKAMAQRVYDALMPTLRAAEIDAFIAMVGPNAAGKYTVAGGVKLKDAGRVDQLVRDLVPMIPDPKAKEAITFDAETVGGVKIHKVKPYDLDAEAKRMFGEGATASFAFAPEAEVAAFGADAGEVLKKILGSSGKAGGPFRAEGSISKLAGLDKENGERAKQIAATVYGPNSKADLFHASIEGGSALRLQASIKTHVIKFGVKMDEAAKSGNQ